MQLGVQPTSLKFFPSFVCSILSAFFTFTVITRTYIYILINMFLIFTVTFVITFFAFIHFFCQLKSQVTNLSHNFLIIFFLHIVEEFIGIFCFPFTAVLNIPIGSLDLPIKRNFIFNSKRWNIPYNSIVGLSSIIAII